jgi:predicted O-linked N-acetylglucosamine transferase (SPINDLY family)
LYPGTLGAGFIDYIVADRDVIPGHAYDCYAEKIVWLPDSYQANDRNRAIADTTPVRGEHGLPLVRFRLVLLQRQLQDHTSCLLFLPDDRWGFL